MRLDELLARLRDHKIYIAEERRVPEEGKIAYTFRAHGPIPPFSPHQELWATLTIYEGQESVEREEIESILRHLWFASTPFFGDELEEELKPTDAHEQEIADRVDAKARAIHEGTDTWGDNIMEEMKIAVGFELSDVELEYLDAYVRWRRENPISN